MLQLLRGSTRYIPEGFSSLLQDWPRQAQAGQTRMFRAIVDGDPKGAPGGCHGPCPAGWLAARRSVPSEALEREVIAPHGRP